MTAYFNMNVTLKLYIVHFPKDAIYTLIISTHCDSRWVLQIFNQLRDWSKDGNNEAEHHGSCDDPYQNESEQKQMPVLDSLKNTTYKQISKQTNKETNK